MRVARDVCLECVQARETALLAFEVSAKHGKIQRVPA
jgi:hypothetical protein